MTSRISTGRRSGFRCREKSSRLWMIFAMRAPCATIASIGPPRVGRHPAAQQELAVADHHRERIVQLVRHARDQLSHRGELPRLQELGLRVLQLAQALPRFLVQPGVVDEQARVAHRHRGLRRERGQQRAVTALGQAVALEVHGEHAEQLLARRDRHAAEGHQVAAQAPTERP